MINYFFKFIRPYKRHVIIVILLSFVISFLEGVSAGLLIPLFGILSPQEQAQQLPGFFQRLTTLFVGIPFPKQFIYVVSAIVAVVLLRNIFQAFTKYLSAWLQSQVIADIRREGVGLLLDVGLGFYSTIKSGDIAERINRQTEKIGGVIPIGIQLFVELSTSLVLLGLLFVLSWPLAFTALICSAVIVLLLERYVKYLSEYSKHNAAAAIEFNARLFELLGGISLIKAYAKEQEEGRKIYKVIDKFKQSECSIVFGESLIGILTEVIGMLAIGIIAILAVGFFNQGRSPELFLPQVITFIYILTRIIPKVQLINRSRGIVAGRIAHIRILKELLDRSDKPFIVTGQAVFDGLRKDIRFDGVNLIYPGNQRPALQGISFCIPQGKTTALVGESGAGKTTVVNLILRFYKPQQGLISCDGRDIFEFETKSYSARFGIVSQDTFIFNASVSENIGFSVSHEPTDADIVGACQKANAHDFIMQLPQGYQTMLGDRGVRLSGGQRQRISIARAILRNPKILILDEATSFLDTVTERLIQESLEKLSVGRTVIVIAHRLSTIEKADQIVVLKNGQVTETGNHAELLKQHNYYEELYKQQYRLALEAS